MSKVSAPQSVSEQREQQIRSDIDEWMETTGNHSDRQLHIPSGDKQIPLCRDEDVNTEANHNAGSLGGRYRRKDVAVFPLGYRTVCPCCAALWETEQGEVTPDRYQPEPKKYESKDCLYEMYWGEMLSASEMEDRCDADSRTILRQMRKRGVPRREDSWRRGAGEYDPLEAYALEDEETVDWSEAQ